PAAAIALHPGIGLAALVAVLFLAVRLGAWATVRTWRRVRTGSPAGRRRRGRAGPVRRVAAVMTAAALFTLVLALFSYVGAVTRPSNSSLAIRSVEWLRDNGGAGLVSQAESYVYSLEAPSKGGPAILRLPSVGVGPAAAGRARHMSADLPRPVPPVLHPRIAGEGVWRATQAR